MLPRVCLRAVQDTLCAKAGAEKSIPLRASRVLRSQARHAKGFQAMTKFPWQGSKAFYSTASPQQQRDYSLFNELTKLTRDIAHSRKVDSNAVTSILAKVEQGNYFEADALCDEIHEKVGWLPELCDPSIFMYIRCYRRDKAEALLRHYRKKKIIASFDTYSKLILLSGSHKDEPALDSLIGLIKEDYPTKLEQIYTLFIQAYGRMKAFGKCEDIIEEMRDKELQPTNGIYTSLLEAYCRHNVVEKGLILFRQMKLDGLKPNHIMFNNMIAACARLKNDSLAIKLFNDMKEVHQLRPDIVTWNALIDCYCRAGNIRDARKLMLDMEKQGVNPDARTYGPIIVEMVRRKDITHAEALMKEMQYLGVKADALIWNWIIEGFARNRQFDKAMKLVEEMRDSGIEPDKKLRHILRSQSIKSDQVEVFNAHFSQVTPSSNYRSGMQKDARWEAAEADIPAAAPGAKGRRAKWPLFDADMEKGDLVEKFNPKDWVTIEDPLSQTKPETIQQKRSIKASESQLRIMEREVEEKEKKWREEQRALKEKRRAKRVESRQFTMLKEKEKKRKERAAKSRKARETKPKQGKPKARFEFRK